MWLAWVPKFLLRRASVSAVHQRRINLSQSTATVRSRLVDSGNGEVWPRLGLLTMSLWPYGFTVYDFLMVLRFGLFVVVGGAYEHVSKLKEKLAVIWKTTM